MLHSILQFSFVLRALQIGSVPRIPPLHRNHRDYSADPIQQSASNGDGIGIEEGGGIGFQRWGQMRYQASTDLNFAYGCMISGVAITKTMVDD